MTTIPRALTIAGSDSGGGAGIQADLKTFAALGIHGMSAVTAVTAQNTLGVQSALELPLAMIEAQVRSVATDIGVDAVKTGMLGSEQVVLLVARLVRELRLPNLVVDPVMTAKGGYALLGGSALDVLRTHLLPLAQVVTPNLAEASALLGKPVRTPAEMGQAAQAIAAFGPQWVIVKGGHLAASEDATDLVWSKEGMFELTAARLATKNTHGTGCTFSAAITAGLAARQPVEQAIRQAKIFVTSAIANSLELGHGHGPVNQIIPTGGAQR